MQETWKAFVDYLLEDKKNNVGEAEYQSTIERQLQLLGWIRLKHEICHKPNLSIGNNGHIQPDILIQKENIKQFVIEVKRPQHTQKAKDRDQLVSYMRQLKLKAGLYIGEHIEIFYDQPESENAVSVLTIPLELENKRGARFVELFSKEHFNKETIVQFCENRIKEMQHQESLNKIKENLVNEAQQQITKGMKMHLMEKYGNAFSESDIVSMLATIEFTATQKGKEQPNTSNIPAEEVPKPKSKHDDTQYSINGSTYLKKRRFVHQLVKLYVGQHPNATFSELEQVFPPTLQGSYGVVRTMAYIHQKGTENRYLMKDSDLLHSADGVDFAVSNQWGISNTPKVVELAKSLGYKITTSNESNTSATVPQEEDITCFILTRNADAKGIFNIRTQTLTVLKGSTINPRHRNSIKPTDKQKRETLIAEYTEHKDGALVVVKDVVFRSPSSAAEFCVGGSENGWKCWKDDKNNELDTYRK